MESTPQSFATTTVLFFGRNHEVSSMINASECELSINRLNVFHLIIL